ncbi:MAG: bifunctional glutamate N-acetyltransferase/amino-acid acetyltransferase ArgJ [Acidobacteria bacterium]|nr:bifunctional glutamate N-acetyltransferase/amino-acid acetyltransferase ArgJ [Acidobacteriota bacterium]
MTAPSITRADGGITAPEGYRAAGVACGLKPSGLDVALVVADDVASAAGLFTTNLAVAAPVVVSREQLARSGGHARAIAVNSKCANACTGADGMQAARAMAAATAEAVGCDPAHVLIASTGVIGMRLDTTKVSAGIAEAARRLSRDAHRAAAEAIMTTDISPKAAAVHVATPAGRFTIGGMVKGAGMIEPNLATMLGFLTTDADVDPATLDRALREVARDTFNSITVDGEPSTNDTVLMLANGASRVAVDQTTYPALLAGLYELCAGLAREIVRGGEGATKLVTVRVTGAASEEDARRAARLIANSPLVKTAINGGDPNWGRLVAVAGRAGVAFDQNRTLVRIGGVTLYDGKTIFAEREHEAAAHLKGHEVEVAVDLGVGGAGAATMWTCDFSAEYVHINADYRT